MKSFLLSFLFLVALNYSLHASAPVVIYIGNQNTTVCSAQSYYLLDGMKIKDLDNDVISLLTASSSHPSIINPLDVLSNISFYVSAQDTTEVYAYVPVGNVATTTNVTVTYNFTDGLNTLTQQIIYVVKSSPTVTFLDNNYTICSNQGAIDLNEWVYPQGGTFQYDGEVDLPGGILESQNTNSSFGIDYTYEAPNGCAVTVYTGVTAYLAPLLSISATNSSSCTAGDGQIDASIITDQGINYSFVWNDGNTMDEYRTNLLPGSYHIDVTDANGCIAESTTSIGLNGVSYNPVLDTVTCYGLSDGGINLNVTGLIGGLTYVWSSGQTSQNVSNLPTGNYTVYVTDATGCALSETFFLPQPGEIYSDIYAYGPSSCLSSDGSAYINGIYGGNGTSFSYLWSDGSTFSSTSALSAGIHSLTVTDYKGCSNLHTFILNDFNTPWVGLTELNPSTCGANTGSIDLDSTGVAIPITFTWSNNATTLDQQNLAPGDYSIHVADINGCDFYDIYTIGTVTPALQPICMMTVDSATTTNLVVWDKVEPHSVSYYKIYRETVNQDEFILIDTVQNTNLSLFNDVMASPIAQSWRYKISAVDACGNEGPLSAAHKTMHISTIDLGNGDFQAVWNPYYGIEYDSYILYRYTSSTGWEEIATLPSVINSYNDSPPNSVGLDYMVELDVNVECVADIEKAQDFNTTRSNKDKGAFSTGNGTGDSNNDLVEESISMDVYPNPVSDNLTIEISENGVNRIAYLVTVDGQEVMSVTLSSVSQTMDVSALANGLYFLKIEGMIKTAPIVKN